jgi:hypothetical protein
MVLLVGLLLTLLARGGGAKKTHYSLEPRYDEMQPKSQIHLHRQLTEISPKVSITATPNLLGTNVRKLSLIAIFSLDFHLNYPLSARRALKHKISTLSTGRRLILLDPRARRRQLLLSATARVQALPLVTGLGSSAPQNSSRSLVSCPLLNLISSYILNSSRVAPE